MAVRLKHSFLSLSQVVNVRHPYMRMHNLEMNHVYEKNAYARTPKLNLLSEKH